MSFTCFKNSYVNRFFFFQSPMLFKCLKNSFVLSTVNKPPERHRPHVLRLPWLPPSTEQCKRPGINTRASESRQEKNHSYIHIRTRPNIPGAEEVLTPNANTPPPGRQSGRRTKSEFTFRFPSRPPVTFADADARETTRE